MSLTYPTTLPQNGADITAEQHQILYGAIQQKFGNIDNSDIASNAGIDGSKLAASTLPGDRIAPKTVSQGQQGLLSVGTPELIDLAVTKGKVATAVGSQMTQAQVAIFTQAKAFSFSTGVGTTLSAVTPTSAIPTATNTLLAVYIQDPSFNLPTTYSILAYARIVGANYEGVIYVDTPTAGATLVSGNLVFVYMTKS